MGLVRLVLTSKKSVRPSASESVSKGLRIIRQDFRAIVEAVVIGICVLRIGPIVKLERFLRGRRNPRQGGVIDANSHAVKDSNWSSIRSPSVIH
jgi:hypothetical protein